MYASSNPAPTSASSARRRRRCSAGPGAAGRQRERDLVQVDARDLLDDVGLAGHVAGAPGRHDHVPRIRLDEPEPREQPPLVVLGNLEAVQRVRALGAEMDHGPVGQPRRDVGGARQPGARELQEQRGRVVGGRLGQVAGRRPSPSGSSRRCEARAARRSRGSRSARSSPPRGGRSSSRAAPRSPPRP